MNNCRKNFFLDLIKLAARRDDIEALRGILEFKYPGDRRIPGFAVQYYEKFVKGKNLPTPLTEDSLPQPLPETAEELLTLLQIVEVVKRKTKKEEYAETILLKHPNVDLTNLNEDYLSWLNQRYVENKIKSGEIVHPIEEALVTLRKFPSIQDKYKASAEFREKVKEAGYADIFAIQGLTLDEMEAIISLDISDLTVRVDSVSVKPEEFLGKFGEWNLWLPHTKETSAKIAGYDEAYKPKTTWCTARTKGSNLFYNYIGRGDIPTFLFYIIKDNPKNNQDWLSLGYISQGNRLVPDFSGRDGGLSVDRVNKGLRERDYSKILGDSWNSIKSRIEAELEKHKIIEGGREKYVSPARSIIKALAKNVEEFKKELYPKSNEEKKDFIKVIMDSDPSEDVLKVCGNTLARIDPGYFLDRFSEEPWAEPYLGLAAEKLANQNPKYFLYYFSEKSWVKPYLGLAAKNCAEEGPGYFLSEFSEKPWAQPYIDLAAEKLANQNPKYFLNYFSEKPWAEDYLKLAAENLAKEEPQDFLKYFRDRPWAKDYLKLAVENCVEKEPEYFLIEFSEKLWNLERLLENQQDPNSSSEEPSAKDYLKLAAEKVANQDPKYFLYYFSEKSWVKPDHIELAAKILIEEDPGYFLREFSEKRWAKDYIELAVKILLEKDPLYIIFKSYEPWAKDYLDLAVKNYAEKDPKNFLREFSEKPWAKDYIDLAAKILAEKDPEYFLVYLSDRPWAKPHLKLAAKNCADKHPYTILAYYSDEDFAKDYLDLAAKNLAEREPLKFIEKFLPNSWAKDYIKLAIENLIEKDPEFFLKPPSEENWVLELLSIKNLIKPHHIELAKSKLKAKQASNSIQKKLLKLSNFLKSNNLKEYNYLNYYMEK